MMGNNESVPFERVLSAPGVFERRLIGEVQIVSGGKPRKLFGA
jgi:hypothetical protein